MAKEPPYENPWLFNGSPLTDEDVKGFAGFVYLITDLITGRQYIGRKYFHSIRKVKGKTRRQRSDSDWKSYYGSSQELLLEIEKNGSENFLREILCLCKTRGAVNFNEVRYQFLLRVLEDDHWYNDTISGKYFKDRVKKYLVEDTHSHLINNTETK